MSRDAKHVLMLVNTHVYDDARVMLEATSLVQADYRVSIIGAARRGGYDARGKVGAIRIILTPIASSPCPLPLLRAIWQLVRGDVGSNEEADPLHRTTVLSLLMFNAWLLRLGLNLDADFIHCHDFSPLPAAWLLSLLKGIPLLYDAHENAPDLYAGRKSQVVEWAERRLAPQADVVITVGERLAQALRARGCNPVVVIMNGKRAADYQMTPERRQKERERLGLHKARLTVAFIGTIDPNRELEPLLEATAQSEDVALLIGGRGLLEDKVVAYANRKANIHWLGWVPQGEVGFYTALSDVVYLCANPDASVHQGSHIFYAIPNKLFEGFAAGKALIARRGAGEMGEILETHEAAILLDAVTPETLKEAFRELQESDRLHRLQKNALAAYQHYNWSVSEARLLRVYADLASSRVG